MIGLSTVDMATHWSPLGQVFVFVGVQIGGVGVLTLASIMGLVISRKLGLRAKLIAASESNATVAASTIIILQISGASLGFVLFDVISAFATSGLSTGLTASPPDSGVYVMALTMFLGRVGTVTLAAALAASTRRQLFRRAEERPIVG